MNTRLLVTGVVSIAAIAGTTVAQAQEIPAPRIGLSTPAAPTGVIEGFAGISWGAYEAEAIAALEEPYRAEERRAGAVELSWNPVQVVGREAMLSLTFREGGGLIGGTYMIPYRSGNDCEVLFDRIVRDIRMRYPSLQPNVTKRDDTGAGLCIGIDTGYGEASAFWSDQEHGTSIYMAAVRGAPPSASVIIVGYNSPAWLEWSREANEEERRRDF